MSHTVATARTMRAAVARRFGGPGVVRIEDVPRPVPAADEVLVRVRAFTVSVGDHRIRARDLPRGFGLLAGPMIGVFRPRQRILGEDAAGVVEAVGADVTDFAPGDDVIVQHGMSRLGTHAEYVVERATGGIVRMPSNLTYEEATALPFGAYTALSFLDLVPLSGKRVLVNGASGAVGSAAVQIAVHAGATVTAVTSGANADLARSLGAAHVVDYTRADFATGAEQYDVIVECVGNAPFARVAPVLARGGALLQVIADIPGMVGGRRHAKRLGGIVTWKGAPLTLHDGLARMAGLAASGALRPVVDGVFAFDDIAAAHERVDTGRKRGNVVVRID
jgi:NADPH:quinone reductase-like Zn-dependent oxidoreductase